MKKNKYLVLIVIIFIYFLVLYLIYGRDTIKTNQMKGHLIIDNNAIWSLKKGSWENLTYASDISKLSWQEYKVYLSSNYFGTYNLWYDANRWYLFDSSNNPINYDSKMIATNLNYDLKFKNFTPQEITNFSVVNNVLNTSGISALAPNEYTVKDVISIDFDDDNTTENFYLLSNAFPLETNPNVIFTIVFMEKDGKTYMLYTNIENNEGYNGCKPYISAIFDADNDSEYEILLSCGKYSQNGTIETLYKFKKDSFKVLINN